MDSSLTHGIANAQQRFPEEVGLLEDLGLENLNQIEAAIRRYNIDCDFERAGFLKVATSPAYEARIKKEIELFHSIGAEGFEWLDAAQVASRVRSPTPANTDTPPCCSAWRQ